MKPQAHPSAPSGPTSEPPSRKWQETVAAILMALATLGTAWSSYQSAAWTRRATASVNAANALERQAAVRTLEGNQATTVHTAMFMQWLAAHHDGKDQLARFYATRFPAEVRVAFDRWIEQRPFENPAAEAHPFVTNLFVPSWKRDVFDLQGAALLKLQQAGQDGALSGQYLSNTVLCASTVFFAGVAARFDVPWVRRMMFILAAGTIAFVALRALVWFPVA